MKMMIEIGEVKWERSLSHAEVWCSSMRLGPFFASRSAAWGEVRPAGVHSSCCKVRSTFADLKSNVVLCATLGLSMLMQSGQSLNKYQLCSS
ncbi:Uncharacterised protein [uncultured archaeon]|nr:Uncharacterised protein [uncultured archaeon]